MSHYKPYPAYKDSGVEWVGKVPAHWETAPIKYVGKLESGHTPSRSVPEYWENCSVPWFTLADIWQVRKAGLSVVTETSELVSELGLANSSARRLPPGTVILSRTASVGYPAIMGCEMATSQDFAAWICGNRLHNEYLYCCLLAMRQELDRLMIGSTHKTIYMPDIEQFRCPLPPIGEQRAISAAIKRETARIDALIAKKTTFIELLAKKRQALITHAVTKGMNRKVKMKDSGIEWIGEVPAHWEIRRMATLFREAIRPGTHDLPLLSISIHDGISDDELSSEDRDRRVSQIEDRTKYKRVVPGDLAYNMMRAWQGAFGAVTVDGLVSPAYVVAEPTADFRTAYIEHLLRTPSAIEEMRRYSRGIADFRMRLYWDYFRDLKVCIAPIEEQDAILERIKTEAGRIDRITEKTQLSIALLKKRRSALITAAVTGQIDLRESA